MNFNFVLKSLFNLLKYNYIHIILCFCLSLNLFSQEKILRFEHLTVDEGLAQNTIHGIVQDKYGFIWIGTWGGICRYDGYKFKIYRTEANNPHKIYDNRIEALYKDPEDNIWIGFMDAKTICRYNYETDDFTRQLKSEVPKSITDSLIRESTIFYTYIKTKDYIWQVNQNQNILNKSTPTQQINQLLIQTNRHNGKQIIYRVDPFNRWALNDEYVYDIYLDDNQILWVGTNSGGINIADTRQKKFYHYFHTQQKENSIIDNVIRAICEDKQGNIWIGTHSKGITKIDQKNNRFIHYQHNADNTAHSLINDEIRSIYCDRLGFMWFGTKGGLDKYNPKTNQFSHYSVDSKQSIPHNWVYCITEDHNGYLWIGTWNGIAKYNREKDKFIVYNPKLTYNLTHIRVIMEDSKYNLWVASDGGGIACFKRDSSAGFEEKLYPTRHFVKEPSNPNSLSANHIYSMLEDENGILWIGTGAGLNRLDPEKEKFTCFNVKSGLPNEMILGILNDSKGNLWFSHKNGITKINTRTFKIKNYFKEDGLQANEFSENASFKSKKTGKMYFGGINGFNEFSPENITDNTHSPRIYITDLQILNQPVLINQKVNNQIILHKSIILTKEITLNYLNNKNITIEFAGLDFSNPKGTKYKYILEGFDQDWIITDASLRIAKYSNLDPKSYTFKVIASNSDGIWSKIPATLKITILPPWWKTWWFKLIITLCILLFGSYIIFIVINKIKHLANQNILHERNQLKTLINNIPDRIIIKDNKFRYVILNDASINYLGGHDETEFINKTDFDIFPEETAIDFFNQEFNVLTTGVPIINEESKRYKNEQEMIVSVTKCPIINPKGETIGLLSIIRDITSQKTAEQKIVNQSKELNVYNKILNETNVLLEERQQQIEEQSTELLAQNDMLMERQKFIQEQSVILEKTNQQLIKEKKTLEKTLKQLKEVNATKDKFFHIIAHDLKNPFSTIIGFTELLINNFRRYDSNKLEAMLNHIFTSSNQAFNLLENLLLWAQSQKGTIEFHPEPIDLKILVNENVNFVEKQAIKKQIQIMSEITEKTFVFADKNMLNTVMRNLLTNAIKFSHAEGKVTISANILLPHIEITVSDTGIGIREDIKKKLFRIDEHITNKGTENEKGTGLGLNICKEFIEKHGGKIWVESKEGQGSKFKFTLLKNEK